MEELRPGPIVLLGSGETLPSSGVSHEYLARRLPDRPRIVILETPAGFEPNSRAVAGKIKNFLQRRLQNYYPDLEVIPAHRKGTWFSPDNPEVVAPVLSADEIILGPGSPTYAVRQLRDSLVYRMIAARQRRGSALFLSSAAALAFGAWTLPVYEIYKVGADLHWTPGLDFFSSFGLSITVIPHWNNTDGGEDLDTSRCYMGSARFDALLELLPPDQTLVGIDEHTSLIIDFSEGCCHIFGLGSVTIFRNGNEIVHQTGSRFSIDMLGRWRMPGIPPGVPESVWQAAIEAEHAVAAGEPSAQVRALMQAREEARGNADWPAADALRDRLAELGWEVRDTPGGSELVSIKER